MPGLYPLKFKPIFKPYIWGGSRLQTSLGKKIPGYPTAESWEISGVKGNISIVSEGFLKGNTIQELVEIYMGELVGDKIYERFGIEFPLLIKFIDANQDLSIQVHPDDETARIRHKAYGKTEMWYVIEAEKGSGLYTGFKRKVTKDEYLFHLNNNTLSEILNWEEVSPGDVFFIPAGRIHGIGKGIVLTEIQQTSDITYRVYDWGRVDNEGKPRPLHTDLALDVINFEDSGPYKTPYPLRLNLPVKLIQCPYFTTQRIDADQPVNRDYFALDSFVIYICVEGSFIIRYDEGKTVSMNRGETILLPADLKQITLEPNGKSTLLEVFIA